MTIEYTLDVSSSRFAAFSRLLLRWHGSVWKSVYKELIIWILFYIVVNTIYRTVLNEQQQSIFEDIVVYCRTQSNFIPLTFMLGFFVTLVVQRWWETFHCFGWIDNSALYVATYINGTDERTRMIRRNIVRYAVLVEAMVFRDISPVVRRRFPDDHAFKTAGFLTEQELSAMESVTSPHAKYWLPIHWAFHLIKEAKASGLIRTERAVELVQARLLEFRTSLAKQRAAHGVPVPLAYTQVVFIAVRSYLALTMIGQQYVIGDRHKEILTPIDIYIPLLSILQLLFYLGWVKVAEGLLNPYGDDDDDFECNWFIDRNLQVGFSIVDGAIGKEPPLEKDVFWNEIIPLPLYANGVLNAPIHVQNDSIPKPIRLVEKIIRSSLTSEKINSTVAEHNLESQDIGKVNPSFQEQESLKIVSNANDRKPDCDRASNVVNINITKL